MILSIIVCSEKILIQKVYLENKFLFYFSNKSYGSHKHQPFKDESHKGSMESLDQEEKKDSSKEDLEHEPGKFMTVLFYTIMFMKLI